MEATPSSSPTSSVVPTPLPTTPVPLLDGLAVPGSAQPPSAGRQPLSITDFITDGSLAALCDELTRLTGVGVSLQDHAGRRIVLGEKAGRWRYDDQQQASAGVAGQVSIPLSVEDQVIGALVLAPGEPMLPGRSARALLEETLALLAASANEFCRHEIDLRHRVKEVQALYRLSSMLARATRFEAVLDIALESALDVLELDAGSIVLFEQDAQASGENEADLVLKTSRNLSREWLECPLPLSRGRLFDQLALSGEVVVSHDLLNDERVLIPERVRSEGLRSALHAGLVFQDRPIGIIRLYSREPRLFTDAETRLLKSIAHQSAVAVEQARLLKMQEEDAKLQRQIQLAADVQRRMMPRRVPQMARLDLAARYVPSHQLGGDFYDLFEMGGNLGLVVGDVVGKGVAAAVLMAAVRATLRAHVQDLFHIDDVMSRVNVALCRDTLESEFATLWYGVVDMSTLRLTYCSAGHEPPMVVRVPKHRAPSAADVDELSIGGMVVGIDPSQRYQRGTYDLQRGDVLVAYTDGLPDTLDFSGKKFGKARLRQAVLTALAADGEAPAAKIVEHIFWELRQFAGILERPDDQTVVVLRVRD
jgi:phosphoserine phosphatase RsbU/P